MWPGTSTTPTDFAAGQREPRKAQINRHLALLLFLETVRVDARERLDEGGLAVVNVTGGCDDAHASSLLRR